MTPESDQVIVIGNRGKEKVEMIGLFEFCISFIKQQVIHDMIIHDEDTQDLIMHVFSVGWWWWW